MGYMMMMSEEENVKQFFCYKHEDPETALNMLKLCDKKSIFIIFFDGNKKHYNPRRYKYLKQIFRIHGTYCCERGGYELKLQKFDE